MNKHLPVLIALLGFGLVGCATTPEVPNEAYLDTQSGLKRINRNQAENLFWRGRDFCVPNWLNPAKLDCHEGDDFWNASAINLETDEFYYLMDIPKSFERKKLIVLLLNKCEDIFKSECIVGEIEPNTYYYSGRDYRKKTGNRKLSELLDDAGSFAVDVLVEMAQNSSYEESDLSSTEELEREVEQLRREMVTAKIMDNLKNE